MDVHRLLEDHRAEVRAIVARHGASDPRVFGSVARGDATNESDLDLLVSPGPAFSLLDHVALKQDLEELLGLRVDVVTEGGLHWSIRSDVMAQAVPV